MAIFKIPIIFEERGKKFSMIYGRKIEVKER